MFSNIEQPFLCVYCGAIFIVKFDKGFGKDFD